MICEVCGSVRENAWTGVAYAAHSREKYVRCPGCGTFLFADDLRSVVEFRYNELRGNGQNYIKDDKGRFAGSRPGSRAGGSSVKTGLTKSSKNVRLDSNGIPFQYPTVELPYKEYKNVNDEIGMCWHSKYQGKELCRIVFTHKTYYFENRGIGDYNIYRVTED